MLTGKPLARLGPYQLVRELGRGAMSVVYQAEREGIGRPFAVKVLLQDQADAEGLRRFELEARVMSKLQHPGLVPVVDAGQDGPHRYLVMELIRGRSLRALLDERRQLTPAEAARLLAEIAQAVDVVHREGIVHRDLKPANVLLCERTGRAMVSDFGLARAPNLAASLTRSGDAVGTPLYMSPEQVAGARCDARTDVWALGVILYECLTGRRPFDGADFLQVAAAVRGRGPTPPRELEPSIPPALEAACLRALERDPARRFPSAGDFARELTRAVEAPERPRGPRQAPTPGQAGPGRAVWVAAAILAAGAGAAGAFVFASRAGRAPAPAASAPSDRAPPPPTPPPPTPPPPTPPPPTPPTPLRAERALAQARELAAELGDQGRVLELLRRARADAAAEGDVELEGRVAAEEVDFLARRGRWDECIAAAEALVVRRSDRAGLEARLTRAFALIRARREAEGFAALDSLHLDDPSGPVGLTARASRLIFTGDRAALDLTARALELDPGYFQARVTRGHALFNAGQHREAEAELLTAQRDRPDDPRLHYYLGRVRMALRDFAGALAAWDEALRLVEPHPWSLLLMYRVNSLVALERDPEAIAGLDRLILLEPRDVGAHFMRGVLRWRGGDARGAREDWRRARDLDPDGLTGSVAQIEDQGLREAIRQALE